MAHVLGEAHGLLEHVAHDRLGAQLDVADPRLGGRVGLEHGLEQVGERARMRDVVERLHALVVLHALRLHAADRLAARLVLLLPQHGPRVVEGGLDDAHDVERVVRGGLGRRAGDCVLIVGARRGRRDRRGVVLRVERLDDGECEGAERLIEREVGLQIDRQGDAPAGLDDDDTRAHEGLGDAERAAHELALPVRRLVVLREQRPGVAEDVSSARDEVDEHGRRHLHAALERLGRPADEPLEARLAPRDEAGWGRLAHDLLLLFRIAARLGGRGVVLDLVIGSLHDHEPGRVVPGATGAPRDLVELARAQLPHLLAVELAERRQQHRANRHVDADAERVGTADDAQQSALREHLHEPPVLGQHAGVVHADAAAHEAAERRAESGREAKVADRGGDLVALLPRDDADARQRLSALHRGRLAEVHDVDRRLSVVEQRLHRLVHGGLHVVEGERNGPLRVRHLAHRVARAALEVVGDGRDVAEGRTHEQEPRVGQLEQRHLPRPAPIGVGVVVEFVHDDKPRLDVRPVAQGLIREDLGRAADDGRIPVNAAVTRHHADVLGAEDVDEREELLAHEGLDGGGVVAALALREGDRVGGDGDEALAAAGRGGEDDVRAGDELEDRLLLRGIQRQTFVGGPVLDRVEGGAGLVRGGHRQEQRGGHRLQSPPPARVTVSTAQDSPTPASSPQFRSACSKTSVRDARTACRRGASIPNS